MYQKITDINKRELPLYIIVSNKEMRGYIRGNIVDISDNILTINDEVIDEEVTITYPEIYHTTMMVSTRDFLINFIMGNYLIHQSHN